MLSVSRTVTGKPVLQEHVTVRALCPKWAWEGPSLLSLGKTQEQTCVTKDTLQLDNRHIMKTLEAGGRRQNTMEPCGRQGKPDTNRRNPIGQNVLETSHT
jgi:hypothetical protein